MDAYLSNPAFYPIGTFDETQDGIGNPVLNTPLFRQDLAAPYGSAGEFAHLVDISNGSYTTNLDPTTLVTPQGRAFLKMRAGALGDELADDYAKILAETGVKGFPFVKATMNDKVEVPDSLVGRRVDEQKLRDLKAYLDALPGPAAPRVDAASAARGKKMFSGQCAQCHTTDPKQPVSKKLVELKDVWPGYAPVVLATRQPPLSPVQNSPGGFDDKMIVIDASDRDKRGNALPLLLDLARKPVFLHDASVPGLDALLDPTRGTTAPHLLHRRSGRAPGRHRISALARRAREGAGPAPAVIGTRLGLPEGGSHGILSDRTRSAGPGSPADRSVVTGDEPVNGLGAGVRCSTT